MDSLAIGFETEIAAQFDEESLELFDQAPLQIGRGMYWRKVQELREERRAGKDRKQAAASLSSP